MKKIIKILFILIMIVMNQPIYAKEIIFDGQLIESNIQNNEERYDFEMIYEAGEIIIEFKPDFEHAMILLYDDKDKLLYTGVNNKKIALQYNFPLNKGKYHLIITYDHQKSNGGSYQLKFKCNGYSNDENISGDSFENPEVIKIGKSYYDYITLDYPKKVYRIEKSKANVFKLGVDIAFNNSNIILYDSNYQEIFSTRNNQFNAVAYRQFWFMEEGEPYFHAFYYIPLSKGIYYLVVEGNKQDAGEYSLYLDNEGDYEDIEEEMYGNNNTIEDAYDFKYENALFEHGVLSATDKKDYFTFTLDNKYHLSWLITLKVSKGSFKLYNENDEVLYELNNRYYDYETSPSGIPTDLDIVLEVGKYYIEIQSEYKHGGLYRFKFYKRAPYTDVTNSTIWYYRCINEAYDLKLMTGINENTFAPNKEMTRGMVAMVLYRMSKSNYVGYKPIFKDVRDGLWYSDAITWASENNIVKGYQNGLFGVDDSITREQLATLCYRYYAWKTKEKMTSNYDLTKFKDEQNISKSMVTVVKWAIEHKIIEGNSNGYINPSNSATRAECAKMLLQLYKLTK